MLRARLAAMLRPFHREPTSVGEREAYHSDIRELRPDAWSNKHPKACGSDVEQAMLLAGVGSRDFARVVNIDLTPHLVTPVDDIVVICQARAEACGQQAEQLCSELPEPNPWGRPPLPWHRAYARQAEELYRAAHAWQSLAGSLVNNRWNLG